MTYKLGSLAQLAEHLTLNPESSKKNLIIWTASSVGRATDS